MSSECCSSSPRLDYNQVLKDVTWINEDYPEANVALLEGIRSGIIGYQSDKIMRFDVETRDKAQFPHKGNAQQSKNDYCDERISEETTSENFEFEAMETILRETIVATPLPHTGTASPITPSKRHSALTVRPTIGEERKAWLLEAQRAYCFNDFHNNPTRFLDSASEMFYKTVSAHNNEFCGTSCSMIDTKAIASCPELEVGMEQAQQCEYVRVTDRTSTEIPDKNSSSGSIDEKDSCEFLFQHVEACFKPSKIRLSPRIEKLDKLIPKTSKEFLNTMRIVSTISPQRSEEQLTSFEMDAGETNSLVSVNIVKTNHSATSTCSKIEANHETDIDNSSSYEADSAGNGINNVACRSYKEVCIYGPHTSTTSSPLQTDQSPDNVFNDSNRVQSTSGFPSLPKLVKSATGASGEDVQKFSPPLYSSILQRSPTNSSGCGEAYCMDNHQCIALHQTTRNKLKTSPVVTPTSPTLLGAFDCGFCRTNNEPESVYRSHPLRLNDVVVCPSLRKYVCCFCGATGDKAHTIKYCPKNPIGFFAKKARNSPVPLLTGDKICKCLLTGGDFVHSVHQLPLSPEKEKCREKELIASKEQAVPAEQESKSDSECITTAYDDSLEAEKRASGNWIEAKTKGRKKKSGK